MGRNHSEHEARMGDRLLFIAVCVNVLLTLAQVIGGIISGSLSLVADALHNLGDAAALGIALFARYISRKSPDQFRTFGYKRAELIAALINLVVLIVIGLYLIYEAIWRFFQPIEIHGLMVIIVAGIALVIDIITAMLTYRMSRTSLNIKAAFLHNLSDALASVGVIIAGFSILLYQWYWVDAVVTLFIAGYVLYQGFTLLPETIHILMQGTPAHVSIDRMIKSIESVERVETVHHVHVWQLDEHQNAMEAHVVVKECDLQHIELIKQQIKEMLREDYRIGHSTIEIEIPEGLCNQ